MLCLHIAWNFQEVFLNILSLFPNLNLMSVLFIHEMFLVYKLETFTNCKEVKHIMVVIIAIIYIFLSYDIFDQLLEILSPLPKKKSTSLPFVLTPLLKIQKVREERWWKTLCFLQYEWSHSSQFWFNKIKQYIYLGAVE